MRLRWPPSRHRTEDASLSDSLSKKEGTPWGGQGEQEEGEAEAGGRDRDKGRGRGKGEERERKSKKSFKCDVPVLATCKKRCINTCGITIPKTLVSQGDWKIVLIQKGEKH